MDDYVCTTTLWEELYEDIGPNVQNMEAGHRPEWKDITHNSLIYKSYWAQRNFLV